MAMSKPYNRGTKAKPNWWIKWHREGRSPGYAKIGPDYALAKQVLAEKERQEVARQHGVTEDVKRPAPVFGEAADAWIKMRCAPDVSGQPAFRSWRDDRTKLKLHLRPRFASWNLDEIGTDDVRALIADLRRKLSRQSIHNVLNTLSRIFEDQPQAMRLTNPVHGLTRHDRKALGKKYDPRTTPFLKTKAEVRRVYLAHPDLAPDVPFRAVYAVGALAGLRPGEARALEWGDVDFKTELIHIQRSDAGPTKDDDSRHVPLIPALAEVLLEWRGLCSLDAKIVFPASPNAGAHGRYVHEDTINRHLRSALAAVKMPVSMTTYQCGRHTFGAQWVINGGSLEKLRAILGHSSTEVTKRYGHLVPGEFSIAERSLVDLDLTEGKVLPLKRGQ